MDLIDEFMKIFIRCWEKKLGQDLYRLFDEGPKYVRNIPNETRALALQRVLAEENGLLTFLRVETDERNISKPFVTAFLEGLHFVHFLVTEFVDVYKPHAVSTMSCCVSILTRKSNFYLKQTSSAICITLLNNFPSCDFQFQNTIADWMAKMKFYDNSDMSLLLRIMSVVALRQPHALESPDDVKRLLINHFNRMYETRKCLHKERMNGLRFMITSMDDMFRNFPLESNHVTVPKLYQRIKHVSEIAETKEDANQLLKSILQFMNHQMEVFKAFIRKDHEFWHEYFRRQTNNEVNSVLAIESLKIYYEVIGKLFYEDESAQNQAILQNLNSLFVKNITNKCLSPKDLRLSINGYSRISEFVKKSYSDAAIEEMFSAIARRTISLYFSEEEACEQFEDIADYQEALSRILLHISNVSSEQIKQVAKLCVIMIKRFPQLPSTSQQYTIESLIKTVCNIESLKIHLSRELITSIIFEGIVWSCSHSLLIDAELQHELENLSKRPICYKDYVPLWRGLLDQKNYQRSIVSMQITNQIVETCIELIEKLNLTIKNKENSVYSDLTLSQVAENETDFRIFLNMVDLYDEILDDLDSSCLIDKLPQLLHQIIRTSYKHPLVSGFYRLVDRVLNVTDYFQDESCVDSELCKMILQYLQNVLDSVYHFPHELQVSCVQLILHLPMIFAFRLIDETVPIFKIALTVGLNDYELANNALHSLEQYVLVGNDKFKNFIKQLMPSLELYLRSKESSQISVGSFQGKLKSTPNAEEGLEKLQKRILLFFGTVNHSTILEFLHEQSLNTGSSWDKKDLLKYSLNFPDISLDVHLDTMLPRIIELSLNSSDRKTKLAASEVLHSIVAIVLGKTVQFLSADADRFAGLYKILCPALLRLGCDSDEVVRRLYSPLMLQITHWLSSKLMLHSPTVGFLVDSLFDGLSNETNFALRDFSGICLAEFARWTIKQSSDHDLLRAPVNINTIVESITNFALHPSYCRRVAAAVAFNYLHKILSENDEVINIFWLEFFYGFVKSMNGCNDISIWNSISHIKKIFINKLRIFNKPDSHRKIPIEFSGGTFKDAIYWLLSQCGVLDENARRKSIKLFESLASYVPDHNSAKSVISGYLEINGMSGVNKIILKGLDDTTLTFSSEYLNVFLRTLDCYTWLIRGQLIDNNLLFSDLNNKSWDVILNCINNFASKLLTMEFDKMNMVNFRNEFKRNSLQCKTIVSLFDFLLEILMAELPEKSQLFSKLFNENMLALISRCILEPRRVGFDLKNITIMEVLPNKFEKLVNAISTQTSIVIVESMIHRFDNDIQNISPFLFEVKQNNSMEQMINLSATKGLLILQKCTIFSKLSVSVLLSLNVVDKITSIFKALKLEENLEIWSVELESERKLFLEHLLEIHLNHQATVAKVLIEIFLTDKTLLRVPASKGGRKIQHGEYFFNTFRDVIIRCLLNHMMETFEELTKWLQHNPDIVFFLLEELATYLQQQKNKFQNDAKIYANEMIKRFCDFESAINNIESRKKSFINIYRIVVRLQDNPLDISTERGPIYFWILNELSRSTDLSKSTSVLNDFLICLVSEGDNDNFEVKLILQGLKKYRGEVNSGEQNSLLSAKAKECYQTLLTLLPITKSNAVFDALIDFSIGAANFFCNDTTKGYLKIYFDNISSSNALKSLNNVYRLFMDSALSNERFDIVIYFLLPSITCCSALLLEEFFDKNMTEIFKTIWQKLPSNSMDCQKLLVSQIGCYNLIELMFARLELSKINEKYGGLAAEILQNSTTGLVPQRIFRCTFEVRKLKSDVPENKDIMRKLHCSAFNCCITIASVMKEENYYLALFAENSSRNQMIWQNIVDCDKKYQLTQTFKEYPKKRRILLNMKQSIKNHPKINSSIYTCIKSYNLASSTLADNIYAYDFSEARLLPEPLYSTAVVTLEVDELNNHECMAPICGILKIIIDTDPEVSSQSDHQQIPKGLRCFATSMSCTHTNARLFMLKIILNNQSIFKPFAEAFLLPIITIISLMLKDGILNYIITDTLLVLIDWAEVAVPKNCKAQAQEMFSRIVEKVDTVESAKYIVRYNFSIMELLVNVWHECLDIPQGLDEKMKKSRACAVRLILIILSNPMGSKLKDRVDILEFLIKSLDEHQDDKEDILLQTNEAIGLFLKMKYSHNPEELLLPENKILESIREILRSLQEKLPDRLVKCVHALSKAYPILSQFFFEFVTHNHLRVGAPTKARCMEIFLQKITYMTSDEIVRDLEYMKFKHLLQYKAISCEKICLQIIECLVPIFNAAQFFPFSNLASPYSQHEYIEYRQLTYNIFMSVYKKYSEDITEDYHVQMLIKTSKKVLLPGLLDPAEELQQKLTTFWTEDTKFGDKCASRMLNIFDVYLPDVEENFLQILAIINLHLIKKSPSYQNKMFEPLTHSCYYKNYKIVASWRMKNLTYKVPLFTSSYASQYSQRYTLSNLTADDLMSTNHGLMLRATDAPEFEPTIRNETLMPENSLADFSQNEFQFITPEAPPRNLFSQRFLRKSRNPYVPLNKLADSRYTRHLTLKTQTAIKEQNTVKLNRAYRIGDFPDIEITHESVINPLLELIKQDQLVCKDLVVSMVRSLLNQIRNNAPQITDSCENFMYNFCKQLNNVLENRQGNGLIISAILEIMFHIEEISFDPTVVGNVSKASGFNCLGALLLERHLIVHPGDSSPPAKKRRRAIGETLMYSCSESDDWIKLAELYESTSEVDIALSIFLNHMPEYVKLQDASAARAITNWNRALDAYKEIYESEFGAIKRYSHQAMIECLGRLSDWNQIFIDIKSTLGEDKTLDDIVENANSVDNGWMSTWFFQAGIYQILTQSGYSEEYNKFVDDVITLSKIPIKAQLLKKIFPEEIAAISAIDNPIPSRDFLNSALSKVREQWSQLNPLSASLRAQAVIKMRGICNVDMYLKAAVDSSKIKAVLLKYWNNYIPCSQDDLLPWDYHISYRSNFANGLLPNDENIQNNSITDDAAEAIANTIIKLKLRMVEVAYQQKNTAVMKKYLGLVESDMEKCNGILSDILSVNNQISLNVVRYRMLRGEMGNNADKLKFYFKGWKKAEDLLRNNIDVNTTITVKHLISDFSSKVMDFKTSDIEHSPELINNITKFTSSYESFSDDEFETLYTCCFTNLKACCTAALLNSLPSDKIAECHLKLLKFCNEKMLSDRVYPEIIKEFVRSTLKAMNYGSREAAHYFPCLLKFEYYEDAETKAVFIKESEKVPTWRFLMWQTELFFNLPTPLEDIVTPIIRRLIEEYPNAIIYTLRSIIDTQPEISDYPIIHKYKQRLLHQSDVEKFVDAMQYLVRPELYLQYYLQLLLKNLDKGKNKMVDLILKKVYLDEQTPLLQGKFYRRIAHYREEIERIKEMPESDVETHIIKLQKELNQMMERQKDSNALKDYSPWLSIFNGFNIEIPGQYTGERKPIPEYHTKIAKIEWKIQVMKSIRKPIKITFIGNDAKNYNFLVKFGENLRLDEKIERAFGIMNEILQTDIACSQRNLSINTYQVITFSDSFGLIQWIDNTKTLQDFINFTLNDQQKMQCNLIRKEYENWISKASLEQKKQSLQYKEALIKYDAQKVNDKMNQLINKIEWDLLRRTFLILSPSLESFMSSRKNFLTTYATMSIAQWILGIGDRHLENTLISVESGRSIGIDFASAFGGGIDQVLPELAPFRLTNQIKGLMKPFTEKDGFSAIMIHVLRALRSGKDPLVAYLNVVTQQNLNWTEHVNELSQAVAGEDVSGVMETQSYKIKYVLSKLNGDNPSNITLEELKNRHYDSKYYPRYFKIVSGNDYDHDTVRSEMVKEINLTPENQIKCLLDQATDLNILGRTYSGWSPWM
ncbi:hypothetical protein PV327_000244 [Microctonus hyperodae]|uniref:non-specific serine/threonine protein kinase n=1 Tax=Microctonus hyperodae TaxID=165561 RepID=A0AA39G657_MICHY|nr:hypothetical protein PV327_000244 [Microctonus hyperodae]